MEVPPQQSKKPSVKSQLIRIINNMSEAQCQKLLRHLKTWGRKDRRADPRTPCSIPVSYTLEGRALNDFIQNISVDGLFIETQTTFSAGQEITLVFTPPGQQKPIRISGEIVRKESNGIGIRLEQSVEKSELLWSLNSRRKTADVTKERRKEPRLDFHCPVLIQGIQGSYKMTDVSLEGAFIEYRNPPEPLSQVGQTLQLLIRLPTEDEPTAVKARVANVRKHGMGWRFVGMVRDAEEAIHRCFNVAKHSLPIS